jgi:hypothetical protein
MDFLIKGFPIHAHGNPSEGVHCIEDGKSGLPVPHEWVHEEEIPGERHQSHLGAVWVLEINSTVLHIVARPEEELSLTVEFECL